jgi:hypothetical protein
VRIQANLDCRLFVGGDVRSALVADLSVGGAAITNAPALRIGMRGRMEVDRVGLPLPFMVMSVDDGSTHVAFELDAAAKKELERILRHLESRRAA